MKARALRRLAGHRILLLRVSTGAIAAGALMLGQPWGFIFWQEPFLVDLEKPFWAGVYAVSLSLYRRAFWVLVAGVLAFVASAHIPDPERRG